jgi:hypothetical protein
LPFPSYRGTAEGKIHGYQPDKSIFMVGAIDSIIDIVGACIGLELLGKPRCWLRRRKTWMIDCALWPISYPHCRDARNLA